jgi:hypothetical protein
MAPYPALGRVGAEASAAAAPAEGGAAVSRAGSGRERRRARTDGCSLSLPTRYSGG